MSAVYSYSIFNEIVVIWLLPQAHKNTEYPRNVVFFVCSVGWLGRDFWTFLDCFISKELTHSAEVKNEDRSALICYFPVGSPILTGLDSFEFCCTHWSLLSKHRCLAPLYRATETQND